MIRFISMFVLFAAVAVQHAAASCFTYSGKTGPVEDAFMIAIYTRDLASVTRLLATHPDLNVTYEYCESYGQALTATPLMNAILDKPFFSRYFPDAAQRVSDLQMVEFLLQHGASPNFGVPGVTPLRMAAEQGRLPIVKALLRAGALVDSKGENGETALMMAAQHGAVEVVRELARAGADIQTRDLLGNNALMLAAWQHQFQAVKLLYDLGVNPCITNEAGETALDQSLSNLNDEPGKAEISAFLKSRCGRRLGKGPQPRAAVVQNSLPELP